MKKKMARVIKYKDGKKFIRDVSMGRRWEVAKRRVRKRKEGEKKDEGSQILRPPREKEEEI